MEPFIPWIILAVVGLIAGWLAGLIVGGGGVLRNLIVGILGALLGGALVKNGILPMPKALTDITSAVPLGTEIFIATIGAIILVLLARLIFR